VTPQLLDDRPDELQRLLGAFKAGRTAEALAACETRIAECDTDSKAWFILGLIAHEEGRDEDARQAYSSSLFGHVYWLLRRRQAMYLRPENPHSSELAEPIWMKAFVQAAARITAEDGCAEFGLAEEHLSDADAPSRGLFWLDSKGQDGGVRRIWLVDAASALFYLLRTNDFYSTCLGNLAVTLRRLGEQQLAAAYIREAEEMRPQQL